MTNADSIRKAAALAGAKGTAKAMAMHDRRQAEAEARAARPKPTPRAMADLLTLNIGGQPRPTIETRVPRGTFRPVSVGRCNAFGIEEVDGLKWMASCDDHGTFVQTRTKAAAASSTGPDFCDECREEANAREAHWTALRASIKRGN